LAAPAFTGHPPRAGLRSGPSLHPRLDVRAGGVWPLRALRLPGLPADRPIPRIFTALSRRYLGLSGGSSKQPPTNQWFPCWRSFFLKSAALPIELTTHTPRGNRTPATSVKGWRADRYTMGAFRHSLGANAS